MATAQHKPAETAQSENPPRRRFTDKEYMAMAEVGIIKPEERVELIKGEILIMPPIGRDHGVGVSVQIEALMPHAAGRFNLWTQTTIHLGEGFTPEPDLVLLKFRQDRYAGKDPMADDIILIIEDAQSSLAYDRDTKSRLYAGAGVPETWVVDLQARAIERFTDPGPGGYREHTVLRSGDRLSPALLPDVALDVSSLLPLEAEEEPATGEGEA